MIITLSGSATGSSFVSPLASSSGSSFFSKENTESKTIWVTFTPQHNAHTRYITYICTNHQSLFYIYMGLRLNRGGCTSSKVTILEASLPMK